MLRARFALELGRALGVSGDAAEAAACAVEWVHNASLLHDDCVDGAAVRRGGPTPNSLFGQSTALLLGDLAFSQGLEEAVSISPNAATHLVTAVREMTIGELQEEFLRGSLDVTPQAYLGVAARKTGALFEWCGNVFSELSPLDLGRSDPPRLSLTAGILLQIVDDIQDLTLDPDVSGKKQGMDLEARRLSLPIVMALKEEKARKAFAEAWSRPGPLPSGDSAVLNRAVVEAGGLAQAADLARESLASIMAMIRLLPDREGAASLESFVAEMARRQF